jgi:hypothetical protein
VLHHGFLRLWRYQASALDWRPSGNNQVCNLDSCIIVAVKHNVVLPRRIGAKWPQNPFIIIPDHLLCRVLGKTVLHSAHDNEVAMFGNDAAVENFDGV